MLPRRLALIVLSTLAAASLGPAQSVSSSVAANKTTRVNLYHHLGSIEVPSDFIGFVKANWTDAWGGYVESSDGNFRVTWLAGTIQYVRETRKKDILWTKTEEIGQSTVEVSLLRRKKVETLVAKIGWLELSSTVSSAEDEKLFRSIVASYQKERCTTCRSLPFDVPK
ncbi:MAG: hypothetical protein ACT4O9_09060 [Blastocatellia bacterium]